MNEIGIIENTNGEFAKVRIDKRGECDRCGMCMFPKGASHVLIDAFNQTDAKVGDTVKIEIKPKAKTLGIILVFFVPLVLIFLSGLLGYFVFESENFIIFLSLIFVFSWYTILAVIDKKLQKRAGFCSVITEVVTRGDDNGEKQSK